ncbi:MAG: DNA-3-methyladenine glycosylase [Fimbriimonadaceae bacterium]
MKRQDFLEILASDVLAASPLLLGSILSLGKMKAQIVEVEAYRTPDDPACHAHRGNTPRCARMFDRPGLAYVYFTYGNHWMLNMVAHESNHAAAILIRAAKPISEIETMSERRFLDQTDQSDKNLLSGPGKLTQAFQITGSYDGVDLLDPSSPLRIELSPPIKQFTRSGRIGLSPGIAREYPWRFCDEQYLEWASNPKPKIHR